MVANHGGLVRELEVHKYLCSSTTKFHHFCLIHERTSTNAGRPGGRVGIYKSPILVITLLTRSSRHDYLLFICIFSPHHPLIECLV